MKIKDFLRDVYAYVHVRICGWKNGNRIRKKVYVDKSSVLEGKITIKSNTRIDGCYIGKGTDIDDYNEWTGCKIGRFCVIGRHCRNVYGHHPTSFYVAMNSKFYRPRQGAYVNKKVYNDDYKYADKAKKYYNIIGNDVYLTNDVILLEGVKIGDGAVVTPGSVVTKNVPPYAIVRGNPAQVVAYRFSEEIINFLQEVKWWDQDEIWLKEHAEYFSDVKKLKEIIEKE